MTLEEMDEKRALLKERDNISLEKRELEGKLMNIRTLVRTSGLMPPDKYRQCCDSQREYVQRILDLEKRLKPIKQRIRELSSQDDAYHNFVRQGGMSDQVPEIVRELSDLRQHYRQFSADSTRVSSLRTMAAEFALKLDRIIKEAVNSPLE